MSGLNVNTRQQFNHSGRLGLGTKVDMPKSLVCPKARRPTYTLCSKPKLMALWDLQILNFTRNVLFYALTKADPMTMFYFGPRLEEMPLPAMEHKFSLAVSKEMGCMTLGGFDQRWTQGPPVWLPAAHTVTSWLVTIASVCALIIHTGGLTGEQVYCRWSSQVLSRLYCCYSPDLPSDLRPARSSASLS